jgi:endonuclease/exonuclease/phosphatase family metal-dependent hydrolase
MLVLSVARGETLTIASYNLENYGLADRLTPDGYRQEYPKPEEQKRALRRVIVDLNADILAVQEIGGDAYLAELQRDLRRDGLDYPHVALVAGPDPARHVALLSRRPIASVVAHAEVKFSYFGQTELVKRGVLEAHFETSAGDLAVFVVHLKSRFTDRPDDVRSDQRRLGEATAVRDLIWRRSGPPAQARFLVLGDFNDDRNSPPLARFARRGSTVFTTLLPVADSRGETWTHAYRKQDTYSRVDHLCVSPGLKPLVDHGRGRIYDGPGVRQASDHRPVLLTLQFGPAAK